MEKNHQTQQFRPKQSKYQPPTDCFAFMVRHGERADNSPIQEEIEKIVYNWDPPLTDHGIQQAHMTGKYLLKKIQELKVKSVCIESSPFLRSMQTAAAIAKEIGVTEIHANFQYSEWLKKNFFPDGDPLDKLTISKIESGQFRDQYLYGVSWKGPINREYVHFPEAYMDQTDRACWAARDLKSQYRNSTDCVAHIVVTHGSQVKAFCKYTSGSYGSVQPKEDIKYCGVAGIQITGNKFRLAFDGSCDHLTKIDAQNESKIHEYQKKMNIEFKNKEFDQQCDDDNQLK